MSEDDDCYEFKREQLIVRRTHLYYLDYDNASISASSDITLVTQLSADRLQVNLPFPSVVLSLPSVL